jgi:hypothetical protein
MESSADVESDGGFFSRPVSGMEKLFLCFFVVLSSIG